MRKLKLLLGLTRRLPWWLVPFSVSVGLLWLFLGKLRYRTYA
jgi:hypothetical protein